MYITKAEAKHHLYVDDFYVDDDDFIIYLIKVAEDIVQKRIDKPLYKCITKDGDLEASVKHTILMVIGHLYNHREATTPLPIKEVPFAMEYLSDLNKEYHIK